MPTMAALCPCKPYLAAAVKDGKQALTKDHRTRIKAKASTKINASIDFDEAARPVFPQSARWDYLLEVKLAETATKIIAVEFHSVNLSDLMNKQRDSKLILGTECDPIPKIAEWILVPEGNTGGFALAIRRKLQQQGIKTAGRVLEI
jgi:hypothetical protein